jgi:formate hydrogenlyase transcriptional activator
MAPERAPLDPAFTQYELSALLEITRAISKHRDREALFAAIGRAIAAVLPADRVVVFLPGPHGATVTVYAVHGAVTLHQGERIAEGSVPAWVIQNRRPLAVSSREQARDRFPATYAKLGEEGMQTVLALPLLAQERCLGALSLLAKSEGTWDRYPQSFLEEIASAVSTALDNFLSYEEQQRMSRELGALLEVNRAIGRHLRRDELFGALAGSLRDVLAADRFGIELPIDGDRLQGHLLAPHGGRVEPTEPHVLPAAGTACDWVLQQRKWLIFACRDELRERFPVTFDVMTREGMESLCAMPLLTGERCRGVLFFMAAQRSAYEQLRRGLLEQVAGAVAVALDDCLAHEEVQRLSERLAAENVYLQEEISKDHNFGEIIGGSAELRQTLSRVETVAPTTATVLILGETGTGKELIARAIHERSPRRERPLVKVNCSAISTGLVESELFGHVKGAFTGAVSSRVGRFELADGGTLFLDEIGELPLDTQVKLLRVLQEREFEPVGSSETRRVDVRVIAATNRDLEQAVAEGRFRSDLFYRVNVLPIRVPPLRERREDIPLLVYFFVERFAREIGKGIKGVSQQTIEQLAAYDWPGNVRELQNVVERAVVLAKGPVLEVEPNFLLGAAKSEGPRERAGAAAPKVSDGALNGTPATSLDDVSKQHMLLVLERCGWLIEGPRGAARVLGLQPSTLRSRMKKLGIQPRPSRAAT